MRSVWLKANPGAIGSRCVTPAGHLCTVRRSIDWVDAHLCRTRRMAHGWVGWSGGQEVGMLHGLLRWSVGRHWLLRSQCTYSRQRTRIRQSAFMLIAFGAAVNKSGNGVAIDNKAKLSSRSGAQPQIAYCLLRTAQHRRKFEYQTLVDPCFRPNSSGLFLTQFSFLR